jgi:F-type H+-transporting ATPase subunit b
MLINWFTVVAQIVNFLLLVGLLKHFFWGPLVRAIDERQARIAAELEDADNKQRAAQQEMERVNAVAREQEDQCDELMLQAHRNADQERLRMIDESRGTVRAMEAQWCEDLERQRATFLKEFRRRAAVEIVDLTRQALEDLACQELQHSAIAVFLEKLQSFDLVKLREMTKSSFVVRSAAELSKETQEQIRSEIEKRTGTDLSLRFVQDPGMAWGVELRGNGQKIGWSPESYLDAIQQRLETELDQAPGATSHAFAASGAGR